MTSPKKEDPEWSVRKKVTEAQYHALNTGYGICLWKTQKIYEGSDSSPTYGFYLASYYHTDDNNYITESAINPIWIDDTGV